MPKKLFPHLAAKGEEGIRQTGRRLISLFVCEFRTRCGSSSSSSSYPPPTLLGHFGNSGHVSCLSSTIPPLPYMAIPSPTPFIWRFLLLLLLRAKTHFGPKIVLQRGKGEGGGGEGSVSIRGAPLRYSFFVVENTAGRSPLLSSASLREKLFYAFFVCKNDTTRFPHFAQSATYIVRKGITSGQGGQKRTRKDFFLFPSLNHHCSAYVYKLYMLLSM